MKKLLSVLVAIAMCACLCLPAFAADENPLGDLDLENFDLDAIKAGVEDMAAGLGESSVNPLEGIKGTIEGFLSGTGTGEGFDPTGVLTAFVETLNLDQLTELFSGLTEAFGSAGIALPTGEGGFDITGILGGNSGDGAGVAAIMDIFGGVLEGLGLDTTIIESLGQSDIVNFFANLYMGSVPEPTEPTTEPTTEESTDPTTPTKDNPHTGVNDGVAVVAACATLSVAAAAVFVCTRKKHA